MDMLLDTGKVQAVCKELGIEGADFDAIQPAISALKARFKTLANNGYRHTKGLLSAIPLSDEQIDDIIADLIKRAGDRRKNKR